MATVYLSRRPPGPVYDAWGGSVHNPEDWVEVAPGKWALSGSGEATNYEPNAPVIDPDAAYMASQQQKIATRPQQQSSPHFNSALAKAYAAANPLLGQEFLSAGETGLNRGFNPDIAALAGMPVKYGWDYGPSALAGPAGPAAPVTPANPSGAPLFAPTAPNNLSGGYTGQGNTPASPYDPGDSVLANAVARARTANPAASALDILTKKAKLPKRATSWASGIGRF